MQSSWKNLAIHHVLYSTQYQSQDSHHREEGGRYFGLTLRVYSPWYQPDPDPRHPPDGRRGARYWPYGQWHITHYQPDPDSRLPPDRGRGARYWSHSHRHIKHDQVRCQFEILNWNLNLNLKFVVHITIWVYVNQYILNGHVKPYCDLDCSV